jgi:hypothetical protein
MSLQQLCAKLLATDNLPSWLPVHHFNQPKYNYATGVDVIDLRQGSLWIAVGMVLFNPIFWNTVARNGELAPSCRVATVGVNGGVSGRSVCTRKRERKCVWIAEGILAVQCDGAGINTETGATRRGRKGHEMGAQVILASSSLSGKSWVAEDRWKEF